MTIAQINKDLGQYWGQLTDVGVALNDDPTLSPA